MVTLRLLIAKLRSTRPNPVAGSAGLLGLPMFAISKLTPSAVATPSHAMLAPMHESMHENMHENMHGALLRREAGEIRDTLAALAPLMNSRANFCTRLFIRFSITKSSIGNSQVQPSAPILKLRFETVRNERRKQRMDDCQTFQMLVRGANGCNEVNHVRPEYQLS